MSETVLPGFIHEPGTAGISGINAEDEGTPVAGGPFTTINLVGSGVAATSPSAGVLDITHTAGGGGGVLDGILLTNDLCLIFTCDLDLVCY